MDTLPRPPSLPAPASWTNLPGWVTAYILSRSHLARHPHPSTADVYDLLCKLWHLPILFSAPQLDILPHPPTVFIINPDPSHPALAAASEHIQVLHFLATNARAQPRRISPQHFNNPRPQDWLLIVCPAAGPSDPEPEPLSYLRRLPPHARCHVAVFGDCSPMTDLSVRRPGPRTDQSGAETSEAEGRLSAAEVRSREKRLADAGLRKAPGAAPRLAPSRSVAVQRISLAEIWSYGVFVTLTSKAAMNGLDGLDRLMSLLRKRTYDVLLPRPGPRRLAAWLSSHTYRSLHPHAVIRTRVPARRSIAATRAFNLLHSPEGTLPVLSRRALDERARALPSCLATEDALKSLAFPIDRALKIVHSKSYTTDLESEDEIGSITEISRRLGGLMWSFSHTIVVMSDDEFNDLDMIDDDVPQCQYMTFEKLFETIESDF